ncbi:hypothetical protein Tco_0876176 [Tanacetum coccineum]|uniref:Reverse transcriptase Ty1/copia-type domain-containing protein n=1 Tax=Tanacetum coccineum TaxID=301880 RepID=A0ABQ5BRJ4_9ASTR
MEPKITLLITSMAIPLRPKTTGFKHHMKFTKFDRLELWGISNLAQFYVMVIAVKEDLQSEACMNMRPIRYSLPMPVNQEYDHFQMDVKTAFLNGDPRRSLLSHLKDYGFLFNKIPPPVPVINKSPIALRLSTIVQHSPDQSTSTYDTISIESKLEKIECANGNVTGSGETKRSNEPNLKALFASCLCSPLAVTETTDTTLTLPPPPPLLQKPTGHRDIWEKDHLKMEMEMEIPSSSNVKLITECSDTTYTCYEVMKDLIKVSKLPQALISIFSSQVHKWAINN